MTRWRDLSPTDGQVFEAWRGAIRDAGQSGATVPPGVKDLGTSGDVRFTSPDGKQHSVRDVPGLLKQLGDGVSTASRMNTVSPNSPPASTDGYPEGALWTQIAERDGKRVIVGVWQAAAGAWTSIGEDASRLVAGSIDVGLLDAVLIGAALIKAGAIVTPEDPDTKTIARMDPSGFTIRRTSPEGQIETLAKLGPEGDNYLTIGASRVSSQSMATPALDVGELTIQGRNILDLLATRTGVIGRAVRTADSEWRRDATRLAELKVVLQPNRLYRVTYSPVVGEIGVEQGWAEMRLDVRTARSHDPGWIDNFQVEAFNVIHVERSQSASFTIPGVEAIIDTSSNSLDWALTEETPVSILAVLDDVSAASGAYFRVWGGRDARNELRVEDLGEAVSSNGIVWQDPAQSGQGGGAGSSTQQITQTREWSATAVGSYWMSDGRRDTQYPGQAIQGTYNGSNSMAREGYFIFPDMVSELAGATIHWARAKFYVGHTWASDGGRARLWTHNQLGLPGSRPGMISEIADYATPHTGWVDLDIPGWLLSGLRSGAFRGFGLGAGGNTSARYYIRASDGRLQICYTK